MLLLACLACLAAATAAPATYDQRQDGGLNVRADVQNVVFVVALPSKMTLPLLDGLIKSAKDHEPALQQRSDVRVMEAFVEPSEPYHVEIGDAGRAVEVVIAGRRRLDSELQSEAEPDELKLLGATEQCGPGRERDPDTLACRARAHSGDDQPAPQLEQKPQSTPVKSEADQKPAPAKSEAAQKPQPAPAPAKPSPEVVLVSS
ncbi:hypothetical protein NE865_14549 [Phthorimaea operculella]|nr:hypothetical protein NE865_14549 [Phthorimaea operculella]